MEVDVDCISDGTNVVIGGVMEHIEQAGVHSGDSGCSLPPITLDQAAIDGMSKQVVELAKALNVIGIMNTQFAIQNGVIYLLEVNPRASRTIPFVSKAVGLPLAKIAAKAMAGISLEAQNALEQIVPDYYSVKESVFPFVKFPDADPILGPEMKSTGEVMGTGRTFGEAYAKAQLGSGITLPEIGTAFISVHDRDKPGAAELAEDIIKRGFRVVATDGTARFFAERGIACWRINKVHEGRPHIVDMIKNGEICLLVNTTEGKQSIRESLSIRAASVKHKVTYYTTIAAAKATCDALDYVESTDVNKLQDLHEESLA